MKDAEAADENQNDENLEARIQASKGTKEVEMPDAPRVLEQKRDEDSSAEGKASGGEVKPDVAQNTKQDKVVKDERIGSQKSVNVEESVASETGSESGKQVLSEVASLLKEVQKNDDKAKLEVEVKVKKMEGMVKKNSDGGHKNEEKRNHQPA